jgi:hypothetical protein
MPRGRKKILFGPTKTDLGPPAFKVGERSTDRPFFPEEKVPDVERESKIKQQNKDAEAKYPEIFSEESVAWIPNAYVGFISFIHSQVLKCKWKVVFEELKFDDEQSKMMAKPIAKIASKYAPAKWAGETAEIELITMLGIFTAMSFNRAKMAVAKDKEKKETESKRRPVSPINTPAVNV